MPPETREHSQSLSGVFYRMKFLAEASDILGPARWPEGRSHRDGQCTADWQALRARGLPSPTWDIADRVRALGLDGMLYASRTDPRLTHLTLFD